MKKYLQLLRVKNYIKNGLIFLPFVFSGMFLDFDVNYIIMLLGFLAFCASSSIVYILNDYKDRDKDKLHPKKCLRPLASGSISGGQALFIAILLLLFVLFVMLYLHNPLAIVLILAYIGLNVGYTFKFKKLPVIDISVLSMFFILRIYYGAALLNIDVSVYLCLTIMSASLMMGVNKRKKEKQQNQDCRDTLKFYSDDFLSKLSQSFLSLSIVFYTLWIMSDTNLLINKWVMQLSIFLVVFILTYYQYIIEKSDDGNPVDVLLSDKLLVGLAIVYVILIIFGFFI